MSMMEHGIHASIAMNSIEPFKKSPQKNIKYKYIFFQKLNEMIYFMMCKTMKYMMLFILQLILCIVIIQAIPRTDAYIYPLTRIHPARRCHDDCSLIEFKGDY